ncbi:MAG: SIS domain-containing protein [Candidatus Aminicenantes bacterium]|nr:SIS domain-containing protein [Candidatus Aminicenantes bacterium]
MKAKFLARIDSRIEQFNRLKEEIAVFAAVELMETALKKGHRILVFGNGGSATQSLHFAAELVNKFYLERPALPAIALTGNTANITSIANDSDFKFIFSRQVEAIGRENDIALGISTSGTSANVIEAFKAARQKKMKTIALCGKNTAPLEEAGVDVVAPVNSGDTPVIQEMHMFYLHFFAEILEPHCAGNR